MPTLRIDDRAVEVPPGSMVLDACRKLGIEVPTLCARAGLEHFTSCMICVVQDTRSGRLLPACSAPAQDGMVLETASAAVRQSRQAALELLLGDHVGDCEGPCRRGCPAHMDIPLMIRQIAAGRMEEAIATVKADIALPAVLGRICPAPCEGACRRHQIDAPLAIRLLKRFVADTDMARGTMYRPAKLPDTGKRVAIVGAGPTGLACAYYLLQRGHGCVLFEQRRRPGGALANIPEARLPRAVLEREIECVRALGAEFRLGVRVGHDAGMAELRAGHDAVVLAAGRLEADPAALFGVKAGKRGIEVDPLALQTSEPGVFAGGGAVGAPRLAVRAVADGKRIALALDRLLRTESVTGARAPFDSIIGRISDEEKEAFMRGVCANGATAPAGGAAAGFSPDEAVAECSRCMRCDCRKARSCRLRDYAGEYEARQGRFKPAQRRAFERVLTDSGVVFEQGKCIACGLCVRITEERGAALGLSFVGRGIATRIGVAFNEPLAAGLREAAKECVEACPTGALAFRSEFAGGAGEAAPPANSP